MARATQRRVCPLCGRAFAIVLPPDEPEREREKCGHCAMRHGYRGLAGPACGAAAPLRRGRPSQDLQRARSRA